jgi:hypothetical protein
MSNSESMLGLVCLIYKCGWDCSNGGVSSQCEEVTLVELGKEAEIFAPNPERPPVRLVRRGNYLHAEPVYQPKGLVGPMFGGNFIYSSDSRFPSEQPIALHDRWESPSTYDALSR